MQPVADYPDLKDRIVFVTGGGSGIGAGLTAGFLSQGTKVAFAHRSHATPFCDEMEVRYGCRPLFLPCDITVTGKLKVAISAAAEALGPIAVLVNNAANDQRHKTEKVTEEFWDRSQTINLKAYYFACQAVIGGMRDAGGGAIVNFTSISYMMGNPGYASYVAANSGINGLTQALAREFGPDGIRVNVIAPGWALAEKQMESRASPEALTRHLGRQCLKDHLAPLDIVDPVLFLSSSASRMMTGQAPVVDGGVVVTG